MMGMGARSLPILWTSSQLVRLPVKVDRPRVRYSNLLRRRTPKIEFLYALGKGSRCHWNMADNVKEADNTLQRMPGYFKTTIFLTKVIPPARRL